MKNVLFIALLFAPILAHADTKADIAQIDQTFQACLNSPDGTSNSGMKGCTADAYNAADKVLNQVYSLQVTLLKRKTGDSITDKSNAESLSRLVASERAWIAYRNTDSDLQGITMLGGSGESLEIASTAYDLTKARALELADLFQ